MPGNVLKFPSADNAHAARPVLRRLAVDLALPPERWALLEGIAKEHNARLSVTVAGIVDDYLRQVEEEK